MKSDPITETENEYRQKGALRENIEAILVAIVIALFIRTFVVQAFKIPSGSMKQTLQIGDHILVNKFIYGVTLPFSDEHYFSMREPKTGDIIVFEFPEDHDKPFFKRRDFIKRVIGTPGDTVQIIDKVVFVNGEEFWRPSFIKYYKGRYGNYLKPVPKGVEEPRIFPKGMPLY